MLDDLPRLTEIIPRQQVFSSGNEKSGDADTRSSADISTPAASIDDGVVTGENAKGSILSVAPEMRIILGCESLDDGGGCGLLAF